ncbi:hypothetical protein P4H42_07850 [Paenibacillus macerans]|uniref:hypothetical protein n=1 Tax=Paenibacillus macerans TaxID=44252 RepID=UPI002DBE859D|nr:hypothetical protein [Paenibacillus macerans]MEC0329533.1 hypothetical protein [Paenibacillus macerans]MED4953681.1 hypothetical protein [Paenibacillus macerans]
MQPNPNVYSSYGANPTAPISQVSPAYYEPAEHGHKRHMKEICKRYHHHLIHVESTDGKVFVGIIDGMDDDHVYLLIPIGDMDGDDRAFGAPFGGFGAPFGGFGAPFGVPFATPFGAPFGGFGGFGGFPFFGGFPRRFRRFIRRPFPFFGLRRFFFPFFF